MNTYIEHLKEYLLNKQPNYGYKDAHSLLDMLYYYYTQDNPIENQKIKASFAHLDNILALLPLQDNDTVFVLTANLCNEYAKQGFIAGIITGTHLFAELEGHPIPGPPAE